MGTGQFDEALDVLERLEFAAFTVEDEARRWALLTAIQRARDAFPHLDRVLEAVHALIDIRM